MCIGILTALKIMLNWYDIFCIEAQNLRAETLMLNDIRSRNNWMNENLILSLNWYYAEEQKKKNRQHKRDDRSPREDRKKKLIPCKLIKDCWKRYNLENKEISYIRLN